MKTYLIVYVYECFGMHYRVLAATQDEDKANILAEEAALAKKTRVHNPFAVIDEDGEWTWDNEDYNVVTVIEKHDNLE